MAELQTIERRQIRARNLKEAREQAKKKWPAWKVLKITHIPKHRDAMDYRMPGHYGAKEGG